MSVVRKRKLGTRENILKKKIPLSTIISRLGAPQSVDRFSTLQVNLVDRCPVPSAAGWSAQPQKQMCYQAQAHLFSDISSQWQRIDCSSLLILDYDLSPKTIMGSLKTH